MLYAFGRRIMAAKQLLLPSTELRVPGPPDRTNLWGERQTESPPEVRTSNSRLPGAGANQQPSGQRSIQRILMASLCPRGITARGQHAATVQVLSNGRQDDRNHAIAATIGTGLTATVLFPVFALASSSAEMRAYSGMFSSHDPRFPSRTTSTKGRRASCPPSR